MPSLLIDAECHSYQFNYAALFQLEDLPVSGVNKVNVPFHNLAHLGAEYRYLLVFFEDRQVVGFLSFSLFFRQL